MLDKGHVPPGISHGARLKILDNAPKSIFLGRQSRTRLWGQAEVPSPSPGLSISPLLTGTMG